jgi:hypothetical protein
LRFGFGVGLVGSEEVGLSAVVEESFFSGKKISWNTS